MSRTAPVGISAGDHSHDDALVSVFTAIVARGAVSRVRCRWGEATSPLQLTASVAGRQDMRLHDGRMYLLLGCNMECSVYAHGHLNLMRRSPAPGFAQRPTTLEAGHATRIALPLSDANLSAAHRALEKGHPVKATVEVEAGSGGERQEYQVGVVLTWR